MLTLGKSGEKRFSDEVVSYIEQGKTEEIARLLEHCDVNSQIDDEGSTLLHLSVKNGSEFMTKFLIESKVTIDSKNNHGVTPLLEAVYHDKFAQAEILLEAGADMCVKNNDDLSVFSIVVGSEKTSETMGHVFIDRIDKTCTNSEEIADVLVKSGIHMSYIEPNRDDIVKAMLERGYEINLKDVQSNDDTALHNATWKKDLEMIKTLLRFEADKNMKNLSGLIPFDVAFRKGHYEMMQLLVPDNDYDWAGLDHSGELTIYYAFTDATKEMIALFLQHCRVDFTVKDGNGKTPLHCLARNDNEGLWEYCRDLKFDIDAQDKDGRTALHLAFPRIKAVRFLLESGARMDLLNNSIRPPIINNSHKWDVFRRQKECRECLDLLLYYGLDVQSIDDKGSSMISLYHEKARMMYFCLNREYVFEPVLAHLAMLEVVNGLSIKPLIIKHINADDKFSKVHESCKEELEKMKTMVVFGDVTFFKLLSVNQDKITQYARNEDIFEKVVQIGESSCSYYYRHLRIKLLEAGKLNDLRNKAAKVVGEVMNVHDQNYVVEYIVSYLDSTDLKLFA